MAGRSDAANNSAALCVARADAGSRSSGTTALISGIVTDACSSKTSSGKIATTGPGRPVVAAWSRTRMMSGICAADSIVIASLVTAEKSCSWSISVMAPVPRLRRWMSEVIARIGTDAA